MNTSRNLISAAKNMIHSSKTMLQKSNSAIDASFATVEATRTTIKEIESEKMLRHLRVGSKQLILMRIGFGTSLR